MFGIELEQLFLKDPRNLLQSVSRVARRGLAAPCRVTREPYKNLRIAVSEFYSGQTAIPLMESRQTYSKTWTSCSSGSENTEGHTAVCQRYDEGGKEVKVSPH